MSVYNRKIKRRNKYCKSEFVRTDCIQPN